MTKKIELLKSWSRKIMMNLQGFRDTNTIILNSPTAIKNHEGLLREKYKMSRTFQNDLDSFYDIFLNL